METDYERTLSEWPWREFPWLKEEHKELLAPSFPAEDEKIAPADQMTRMFALLPIYVSTTLLERNTEATETLLEGDLIDRVPMFASRGLTYSRTWDEHISSIRASGETFEANFVNLLHVFAPMYVQQLESPLRYDLAALLDLLKTFHGDEEHWQDRLIPRDDKQSFRNLLNEVEQHVEHKLPEEQTREVQVGLNFLTFSEENSDYLEEVYDFRLSPHPSVSDLRNSFAHSDYNVQLSEQEGIGYEVVLYPKDTSDDVFRVPLQMMLGIMRQTVEIMSFLSRGMTIALGDIAEAHDMREKSYRITEGVSFEGYPRHEGLMTRIEEGFDRSLTEMRGTEEEYNEIKQYWEDNPDSSDEEALQNTQYEDIEKVRRVKKHIEGGEVLESAEVRIGEGTPNRTSLDESK
jgi:hypothetical protein